MPNEIHPANLYATQFVLVYYAQNNLLDNEPTTQSKLA